MERSAPKYPFWPGWVWAVLVVVRAAALFLGIDLLPMTPSVFAEVIINDPAVALSRGFGLVAFSLEGSVNGLDRLYAHFPPLFIFLQSLVFRVFGFSAISLRLLAPLFDLAACAVFLLVIFELFRCGILDRTGAWVAGITVALEPTLLMHSREARMESLITLLGGIAFCLCLRAERDWAMGLPFWLGAAVASGAALTAHPSALVVCVVPFVWSLRARRRMGNFRWLVMNALPGVIFVIVAVLLYGAQLPEAVAQLRHLSATAPGPDLRIGELFGALIHGKPVPFSRAGGLGLLFTLVGFGLAVWRLVGRKGDKEWRRALFAVAAILLLDFALLQFVIPTSGQNRAVMISPFGLICAGIALSHLPASAGRWIVVGGSLAAALQCFMIVAYLSELRHGWSERTPDRLDAIVNALPANARVAGPPELWYAFRHHDRQFAIIYTELGELRHWSRPDAFGPYDAVILDPGFPDIAEWRRRAAQGRPFERVVHTYGRDLIVYARTLDH